MQTHVGEKDIYRYIYGMLPEKTKIEVDLHISECEECMAKVTELLHRKMEACKKIGGLFLKAYKNSLTEEEVKFWDAHIKLCDKCALRYAEFVKTKEEGFISVLIGHAKDLSEIFKIQDFLRLPAFVIEGKTEEKSEIRNVISLSKKGIVVVLVIDKGGNIKAYMSSDRHLISGVKIALADRKKTGFEKIREAITNSDGVADLGNIATLPRVSSKKGYAVILSNLKEKVD
ncbi:MAG: zf-HC2 domain-containing protein [Deltaproteobacteria bacterium]|nr:zf-HC2 domain-containing protein [Deltaproteobacteria bacterium]